MQKLSCHVRRARDGFTVIGVQSSAKRAMRILFVIGSLDVGGAEKHLLRVLPGLARAGHDVAVQTLGGRGVLAPEFEVARIPVFAAQEARCAPGNPAIRALRLWRAAWSLGRTLWRWRPDIVHFFLPGAYLIGAPIALLTSSAARVMSRRSLNDYQRQRPLVARFERMLHRFMHAVSGNSQAVIAQLRAEGVPDSRLRLIRNGLDFASFEPTQADPGADDGKLTMIIVANLIPYKGHADLVDALGLAADRMPEWRLLCIGRDDGILAALRAQAAARGVANRIEFLGPRDDVASLLAQAQMALLCSHEEGFPNAAIEAMAAGLPLVACAVGGVPEAVEHGTTGLLVPPRDIAALAGAILDLAHDPARRAAMGVAARAKAHREFALERCVADYLALYDDLDRRLIMAQSEPR